MGGAGLSFGIGSGEGIASKRTAGGNQYGLDFYTGFTRRMSLSNAGDLSIADPTNSFIFPATTGVNSPMIFMFAFGHRERGPDGHCPLAVISFMGAAIFRYCRQV